MAKKRKRSRRGQAASTNEAVISLLIVVSSLLLAFIFEVFSEEEFIVEAHIALLSIVLLTAMLITIAYRYFRDRRIEKSFTVADIDSMDGVKFEHYLAQLLRWRGYSKVRVTEKYDLGVDIIAHKDGVTWGIQAKRYRGTVKVEAVRQVYTALKHYKCDRAMVITNSTFTRPARQLAQDTQCVLVERDELARWIYEAKK